MTSTPKLILSRSGFVIDCLLLSALWLGSLLAWPQLPSTIPVHFNVHGNPDNWVSTTANSWFFLPSLALLLSFLVHSASRFLRRNPRHLLSSRQLRTAVAQQQMTHLSCSLLDSIPVFSTIMLSAAQLAIYRAALGRDTGLTLLIGIVLPLLGLTCIVAIYAYRISLLSRAE